MKLTDFKVIYICPDHNEKYHKRKLHMDNLLNKIGFTKIEHYKSDINNYPQCLLSANINILKNNLDEPFILLEDDVEWTGIEDFDFSYDCDAVYLGLSKWGGHPTEDIFLGRSQFEKWSDKSVKVINMLTTHAILYNSKKYKEAVIDLLEKYINIKYNTDVLISRIQSKFLILAPKYPLFYQSSNFNTCVYQSQQRDTLFTIEI